MNKANFYSKILLGKLSVASSGIQDLYTVLQKNPFFAMGSNFDFYKISQCGKSLYLLEQCADMGKTCA